MKHSERKDTDISRKTKKLVDFLCDSEKFLLLLQSLFRIIRSKHELWQY